jgi:LysR family transcriptional activator of nhaA
LPQLAAHRLDIVLADEPASTTASMKVFNHSLGNCGVTFCAVPLLAKRLAAHFPKSLDDAPALLPSENTALRMTIERWFHEQGVRPRTLGEFEDPALMKAVAGEVQAVFPLHSIAVAEATQRFGFKTVGKAKGCRIDFYAITAERRIKHPAVAALTENAQTRILKSK